MMNPYLNRRLSGIPPYTPGEQPQDTGYIKLNTNENPFPPAPGVLRLLRACQSDILRLYPDPSCRALREAIARRYGVGPDEVFAGNGSDEILRLAILCFSNPDEEVIFPSPSYPLYETLSALAFCKPVPVELEDDFSLPESFITGSPGCLRVMANPNSPSGTFYDPELIEKVAGRSSRVVIVDEAYADFAPGTALPLVRKYPNLLVTRTFSKSFSLAGLRAGYCFGNPHLIRALLNAKDSYNLNALSQKAAVIALEEYDHMLRTVEKIKNLREGLRKDLEGTGFFVFPSESNFLLARPPDGDGEAYYLRLKEKGILVRFFDTDRLRAFVRITVGTEGELRILVEATRAMFRA